MHDLLEKFLVKIGAKSDRELTDAERATFGHWSKELAGRPVTIEDLKKFLKEQQIVNLSDFEDFENSKTKDLYLKVYSRLCRQIISFIEMPEKIKKAREDTLKDRIEDEDKK